MFRGNPGHHRAEQVFHPLRGEWPASTRALPWRAAPQEERSKACVLEAAVAVEAPLAARLLHRHLGQASLSCLACREAEEAAAAASAAAPPRHPSPHKQAKQFAVRQPAPRAASHPSLPTAARKAIDPHPLQLPAPLRMLPSPRTAYRLPCRQQAGRQGMTSWASTQPAAAVSYASSGCWRPGSAACPAGRRCVASPPTAMAECVWGVGKWGVCGAYGDHSLRFAMY